MSQLSLSTTASMTVVFGQLHRRGFGRRLVTEGSMPPVTIWMNWMAGIVK
jgi:hypothetical protein